MNVFQIFLTGAGIFFGMVLCLYLCNGFKVTSPHNRRKREREVRRQTVYVITRQMNPRVAVDATQISEPPPIVHSAPPDYTTLNPSTLQNPHSVPARSDICPPPSYNEAIRADRRMES